VGWWKLLSLETAPVAKSMGRFFTLNPTLYFFHFFFKILWGFKM
jgi:hypothetical protein